MLVKLANDQGSYPTLEEVDAYGLTPFPRSIYETGGGFRSMMMSGSVSEYLTKARLVTVSGNGVYISDSARALVGGMEQPVNPIPASKPLEVVGRMSDPVAYAQMLIEVNKCEHALVVDPYLLPEDLIQLAQLGSVDRVLTKDGSAGGIAKEQRKTGLAIALGVATNDAELRFQAADTKELHDRLILPKKGEGLMIGTSLGGTQITVVSHLSEDMTTVIRSHYEDIYAAGTSLDPIRKEE